MQTPERTEQETKRLINAIFGTKTTSIADSNGRILKVGDTVCLPEYARVKKTKRQAVVNLIVSMHPEQGREYIVLAKKLRNGKASKDTSRDIYWHIRNLKYLVMF